MAADASIDQPTAAISQAANQVSDPTSGVLVIKKEFLAPATASDNAQESINENKRSHEETVQDPTEADSNASKRSQRKQRRGQNKPKDRHQSVIRDAVSLCHSVAAGGVCPRATETGDRACKYSHDLVGFMDSKDPDIGDKCPIFELLGVCKYGVRCRFALAHVKVVETETGRAVNHVVRDVMKNESEFVRNAVMKDGIRDIKKRGTSHSKSDEFVGWFNSRKDKKETDEVEPISSSNDATEPTQEVIQEVVQEKDHKVVQEKALEVAQEPTKESNDHAVKIERIATESSQNILIPLRPTEKKIVNFQDKTYLAPLTTVGNLPFRRICKSFGVDITCGEMAITPHLLNGQNHEWALLRRHASEDVFGVQIAGNHPVTMTRCVEAISNMASDIDFIDINMGCPVDSVTIKGSGSALLDRRSRIRDIVTGAVHVSHVPITVKMRTGVSDHRPVAHSLIPMLKSCGVAAISLHGRSKNQRYTKIADWDYIRQCASICAEPIQRSSLVWSDVPDSMVANRTSFFGNGDILNAQEYWDHMDQARAMSTDGTNPLSGIMIGRGALMKPWIFTEIRDRRVWDISSRERFDMLRNYARFGLEHWGTDLQGVNVTRRFLCEWLSFLYRYVPVGLIEVLPQRMNARPCGQFVGRDDLETLMASPNVKDWIKISEMLLGPAPESFKFVPKHKSNAYEAINAEG